MEINWDKTKVCEWEPSRRHTSPIVCINTIESIAVALEHLMVSECTGDMMDVFKVKMAMWQDKVSIWDLLELGAKQIRQHRKVWETHLNEKTKTGNFGVEFPIGVKSIPHLRYFKVLFTNGSKGISPPSILKKFSYSYHEATKPIEVIYE